MSIDITPDAAPGSSTPGTTNTDGADGRTWEERRRARNLGIAYLVLAAVVAIFFTRRAGSATFNMDAGRSFGLAAQPVAWFAVGSLAVLAGVQLWRGFGRWSTAVLAIGTVVMLTSFLTWAAAGRSFSLVGMLAAGIKFTTPLVFGACAGIIGEKSGVINIAIEGLLLNGAFVSTLVGSITNFWVGVLAAAVTSCLFALLLAWLAIRFKVDQIIIGFFINFLVLGLTSFLSSRILSDYPQYNDVPTLGVWKIPLIHKIPVVGPILFEQTVFVYAAFALVAVMTWFMYRTRWGLRTLAVGEHPRAADTVGINVARVRYRNVALGGVIAGIGGSWWTADVGRFNENITAGKGFIALAVLIIGRWHPVGALVAALVFGLSDAIADKLALFDTGIPSEFIAMTPYLATIIVVCGFVGRSRGPAAAGQPYESQ